MGRTTANLLTRSWTDELVVLFRQTNYHLDKVSNKTFFFFLFLKNTIISHKRYDDFSSLIKDFSGPCVKSLSNLGRLEEIPWSTMWPGTNAGYPFLGSGRTSRSRWKTWRIRNSSSQGRTSLFMWWLCIENDFFRVCISVFRLSGTYKIIYKLKQCSKCTESWINVTIEIKKLGLNF